LSLLAMAAPRFLIRACEPAPELASTVAVGWRDCACGAGPLALAALQPPDGCVSECCKLEVVEAGAAAAPAGRLITFREAAAGSAPRTSLLLLSAPAALGEAEQTALAAAVFEFAVAKQRAPEAVQLLLCGAMRFPALLDDPGTLRALAFNGASSRKRPGFPGATPVPDGFLASLLNVARASGTATLALLAPAHLLRRQDADCLEVARTLAVALCGYLDCASGDVEAGDGTAGTEGGGAAAPSLMYV